jgi:uncharacterized membrane protein YraQ (UPF0718 family)
MVQIFFHHLWHYSAEVVPALLIGFFLSGLAHEFIPQRWVDNNLGKPGLRPILIMCWVSNSRFISFSR